MFSATSAVACVLCREGRKEKDVNNSVSVFQRGQCVENIFLACNCAGHDSYN